LICFNWTIHMTMTIQRVITVHSMLADIVDEQELATGKRNEGIVFAAAFFSSKFMGSFGYMIAGPFLDVIGLQTGAQPGEVSSTVTWGLGLIMGPGLAIIMLLPVWMSFKVNVSQASQLDVRQALSQGQQAAESGDAPPSAHQGEPSLPSSISKDATETPSGRNRSTMGAIRA
jgi:glycoside/pentoside/hexuronide:cation symporter, GPH family